jgi:hypothetical protein
MAPLGEVVERADEEGVARGIGDGAVEQHVFLHAVAAGTHRAVQGPHRLADAADIGQAAAFGGQSGDLGLECAAHLDHLHHRGLAFGMVGFEVQRRKGPRGADEDPATLFRIHQPERLQPGHGFAHHGAAHLELFDQPRLGWQACAGREAPGVDFGGQLLRHLVGQAGAAGDGQEAGRHGCGQDRGLRL